MRKLPDMDYAIMRFLRYRCQRPYAAIGRVIDKHRATVYNCLLDDEPRRDPSLDLDIRMARAKW